MCLSESLGGQLRCNGFHFLSKHVHLTVYHLIELGQWLLQPDCLLLQFLVDLVECVLHEEVVNVGSGSKQLIHVGDRHYRWGCEHNKLHLQIKVEVILDLSAEFFEADKGVSQIVDEPVSILQLDYQLNNI
jgi:hypothetical protein